MKNKRGCGCSTFLVLLTGIIVGLAITNPSKADYTVWVKEQAKSAMTEGSREAWGDLAGSVVGGIVGFADNKFSTVIDGMIEAATEVKDYKLFTIFKTGDDFVVLGIFKSFINLSGAIQDLGEALNSVGA